MDCNMCGGSGVDYETAEGKIYSCVLCQGTGSLEDDPDSLSFAEAKRQRNPIFWKYKDLDFRIKAALILIDDFKSWHENKEIHRDLAYGMKKFEQEDMEELLRKLVEYLK